MTNKIMRNNARVIIGGLALLASCYAGECYANTNHYARKSQIIQKEDERKEPPFAAKMLGYCIGNAIGFYIAYKLFIEKIPVEPSKNEREDS